MARKNQILAWVRSSKSATQYEVALEVDVLGDPKLWLSGKAAGLPRVMCECRSMINRTGVDERGACKHIRAVLGYRSKDRRLNKRSDALEVHEVSDLGLVRNWRRKGVVS